MSTGLMNLLLVLHILGAATWIGCNVAQAFLGSSIGNASSDVRLWWSEAGERLGKIVYSVAGVVILVTGIGMVADEGGYSFSDGFVSIGLAAVIIGIVLGIVVFGPKNRALGAAVRAGDDAGEAKLRMTIMQFGILDTLVVVFTVFAMVYQWGVG